MVRRLVVVAALTLSLAGCGLFGTDDDGIEWAETVHTATGAVTAVAAPAGTVLEGFPSPPLAVDKTLRVTAFAHRLVAQPIDAPVEAAAHWSYERGGDVDVSDVRLVELGGRKLVVSGWDDGGLVALEALTGAVVWHAQFEPLGDGVITGRFNPPIVTGNRGLPSMFAANFTTAGSALVVGWARQLAGYDLATGNKLWHLEKLGCENDSNWNPMGAFIAIDVACANAPQVYVKVLDARTGTVTSELRPESWPVTRGSTGVDHVDVHGCRADESDCLLLRHHNSDGSDFRERFYTMDAGGRLVAAGPGVDYRGYGFVQGGGEMLVVDQPSDKIRWKVTGDTRETGYQFGARNHTELRPEDRSIWVSSPSWFGGDRLLANLDAKSGKVLSCAGVPTGKTVTYLHSLDGTRLITATYADSPNRDYSYALYLPKKRSCKGPTR